MATDLDLCKIYVHQLHFALPSAQLELVLSERGIPQPYHIYMRNTAAAPLGKAFLTFASQEEALICKLSIDGMVDSRIAPGKVEAT